MKRTVASVVVLVAFGSFNLAEAGAATVGSGGFGTTLQFSAAPGEINDVTIARSGETYTVTDTINLISPGSRLLIGLEPRLDRSGSFGDLP